MGDRVTVSELNVGIFEWYKVVKSDNLLRSVVPYSAVVGMFFPYRHVGII